MRNTGGPTAGHSTEIPSRHLVLCVGRHLLILPGETVLQRQQHRTHSSWLNRLVNNAQNEVSTISRFHFIYLSFFGLTAVTAHTHTLTAPYGYIVFLSTFLWSMNECTLAEWSVWVASASCVCVSVRVRGTKYRRNTFELLNAQRQPCRRNSLAFTYSVSGYISPTKHY